VQTTTSVTGLSPGVYTVTVTDNNGCTVSATVTINNIGGPTATISSIADASCFAFCDGSATSSVSSGTSPYTYSWNSSPVQTGAVATGLCAGVYQLTVTDAIGCATIVSDTVYEPSAINIVTATTPVNCGGGSDGTATATPSGGASGYNYQWSTVPVQTTPSVSNLTAGTYTVTVTDSKGCTSSATVSVAQTPVLAVTVPGINDATCSGVCDGAADASSSGGTSPYTYAWNTSPVQTSKTVTGLCAGTFTVTVTDSKGCTSTATAVIAEPTAILLVTSKTDAVCGSNNGTATVTASGGTTGYIYEWNTVPVQTTSSVANLPGGIYTVTVTDNNGCSATAIAAVSSIGGASIIVNGQNDVTCFGVCDGAADVSGTGGTAPYTFSWNTTPPQTGGTATGLCAGDVLVSITDANGCVSVDTVTILGPSAIVPGISDTNITCNGSCNGIASVNPSGGTPGYNFSWNTVPVQTTQTITGLCAGTYTVTVMDNNGCSATASSVISEPPVLAVNPAGTTDATCNAVCDGDADVSPSGGTSPYTYQWSTSPAQTTRTATGLCAGTYTVTVTDANGCTATLTLQVNEPTAILAPITKSDANCNQSDGSATVNPSGGSPGYNYQWSTVPVQFTGTAANLSAGVYTVTVTDISGCTQTSTVAINNINGPVPSVTGITDATCNAACNGSATASATGGSTPYTFSWDGGPPQSSPVATGLCAGAHTVTITDKNGCIGITNTTINEPSTLSNVITRTNTLCNNSCDGTATASAGGGTSPYIYSWSTVPPQTGSVAIGLCSGLYTVTITDVNGCTMTDTISVFSPPALAVSKSSTPVSCLTNCDGTATATPSGGTSPYTYTWNTSPAQNTPSATGLCLQVYTVTITDVNGCTLTDTVKISALDLLIVTVDDDTLCRGDSTVVRAGGAGTYTWAVSTDPTNTIGVGDTMVVAPMVTTTYIVTGINGACASADSITVTVNPRPQIVILGPLSVLCKGDSALLTVTGAHTYLWSTSSTNDSVWVKPLVTTIYSVTGTDTTTGCDTTASYTVVVDSVSIVVFPDTICQGDTSLLTVSGADLYQWELVDSPWTVLSNNDTLLVKPLVTTCYKLTAINATTGCTKIDTVCVIVQIPVADAGPDIISCFGDSVYLNGSVVDASGGYWWTTSGGGTFFPDSTGMKGVYLPAASDTVFDLMFTTIGLCKSDTDTVTVTVRQNPTVYAGPDKYIVLGATVKLNGYVTNSPGVKWTTSGSGTFIPNDSLLNPTYIPSDADYETGKFYLILTTVGACKTVSDTMVVFVTEIKAPNVFTPNGDGFNDRFVILGAPEESRLVVFNRWGQKVFESNNYLNDWDGEGLNTDVYYYILTYKSRSWHGWVKVIKKE
jgi:gliding motility-associated-like protein